MKRKLKKIYYSRGKGIVFVATLFVIVMLLSLVMVYSQQVRVFANETEIQHANHQTEANVDSAIQAVLAALSESVSLRSGKIPTAEQLPSKAIATLNGLYWIIYTSYQEESHAILSYGLTAENAKINLNTTTLRQLQRSKLMTDQIAGAIIDWKDGNSTPSANGAETEYYQTLEPPYRAKNSKFEILDELLLVNGVTPLLFYGEDLNGNGRLDDNENDGDVSPPLDNSDGVLTPGFMHLFTVYSNQKRRASDRGATAGLVNILYATPRVLRMLPGVTEEDIDLLLITREQLKNGPRTWNALIKAEKKLIKFKRPPLSQLTSLQTYQFQAEIVGLSKNGKCFKRVRVIFDTYPIKNSKKPTPRMIAYRDITHLGWPLDDAIRRDLQRGKTIKEIQDVHGTESF